MSGDYKFITINSVKTKKTKTKIRFTLLAAFLILLFSESKAQNVTFDNQFNCDVTIGYEMRDGNGSPCGVCATGTLLLAANSTSTILKCPSYYDMCINVTDIDGCVQSAKHLHGGNCHAGTTLIFGGGNAACCNGATWTASWNLPSSTFVIW